MGPAGAHGGRAAPRAGVIYTAGLQRGPAGVENAGAAAAEPAGLERLHPDGTATVSGSISGGVAQWQSVRFACGKPRVQTPAPPTSKQLRGAMDSVSDFESGACGFESRRSCLLLLDGVESEGYGFDSRIGLTADWTDSVAEWLRR